MELNRLSTLDLLDDEEDEDEDEEDEVRFKYKSLNRFSLWLKRFKFLDQNQQKTDDEDQKTSAFDLLDQFFSDQRTEESEQQVVNVSELDPAIQEEIIAQIAKYNLNKLDEIEKSSLLYTIDFLEDLSQNGQLIPAFERKIGEIYSNLASQGTSLSNHDLELPFSLDHNQELLTDNHDLEVALPLPIPVVVKTNHYLDTVDSSVSEKPRSSKKHSFEDFIRHFSFESNHQHIDQDYKYLEHKMQNRRHLENLYQAVEETIIKKTENQHYLPKTEVKKESFKLKPPASKEVLVDQKSSLVEKQSLVRERSVELHLSDSQYLDLAQKIKVDSISLKQLYETRQISINGLKRVVKEYLKTGDISQYLKMELIERQKDFERDPLFRDIRKTMQELKVDHQKELSLRMASIIKKDNLTSENVQTKPIKDNLLKNDKPTKLTHNISGLNLALTVIIACLVFLILILLIIKL